MKTSFRDFLRTLAEESELRTIERATDLRDVSALIEQSRKALMFNALQDYSGWRLAGGLLSSRKRLALAMATSEKDVPRRLEHGLQNPVPPVMVETAVSSTSSPTPTWAPRWLARPQSM